MNENNQSAAELVGSRYRQIHLDFHTSPHIPDVGIDFDPDTFGHTLTEARVNWITLFGKCHHGMSYYPTKAGVMHPSLNFDLLGQQIEACKKRGIAAPIYISARVDQHMGMTRSDLVCRLGDGKLWGPNASEAGWYQMCMGNKEYIDYLAAQTEEVLKNYDADGIFYDMCYFPPDPGCFCEKCLARLAKNGHSREDKKAHRAQTFEILRDYSVRLAKLCRDLKPNATTFFNSRVTENVHRELDVLTHLEIESLTTGGWGYLYFPCWSRLVRTYPRPLQGMTARFHKSWADFGGLKTVPQLEYEASTILAAGGVVNIGDQLHPRGTLDVGAYQVIGQTFKKVEALEEYCVGAVPIAEAAVLLLPDEIEEGVPATVAMNHSFEGAAAILSALKIQWNGETSDRDNLANYKLLIIPDGGKLDTSTLEKLRKFIQNGGSVLFSHQATQQNGAFSLPDSPVRFLEDCPWKPSYMRLGSTLGAGQPETEFVNYQAGTYVEHTNGSLILGEVWQPYFNRSPEHFSSHAQTPVDKPTGHPVGVVSEDSKIAYLFAAVFRGYRDDGFYLYKDMTARMLEILLPEPIIKPISNIPAAMEIAVTKQAAKNRTLVHLINFQPQRRTAANEFIECEVTIGRIEFAIKTEKEPSRVSLAEHNIDLEFSQNGIYCNIVLESMGINAVVVIDQ